MGTVKKKVRVRTKGGKTYMRSMNVRSNAAQSVHVRLHKTENGHNTSNRATKVGAVLGGVAGAAGGAMIGAVFGGAMAHRQLSGAVRSADPWLSVGGMGGHNKMIGNIMRNNPQRAAQHYGGAAVRGAAMFGAAGGLAGSAAGAAAGNLIGRALTRRRSKR